MENADVSLPLSPPSPSTFSERFRVQVLRGKSLALDRIPLLGLSIFGIADEGIRLEP